MDPNKKDEHIDEARLIEVTDHLQDRSEIVAADSFPVADIQTFNRSQALKILGEQPSEREQLLANIKSRHSEDRPHFAKKLLAMDPTDAELNVAIAKVGGMKEEFAAVLLSRPSGKRGADYTSALMECLTAWGPRMSSEMERRVLERLTEEEPTTDDVNHMLLRMNSILSKGTMSLAKQALFAGNVQKALKIIGEALSS